MSRRQPEPESVKRLKQYHAGRKARLEEELKNAERRIKDQTRRSK
jgi:hypothetical protein